MSSRVITLFGEELQPEQINAVGKSRATKKSAAEKEKKEKKEKPAENEPPPADDLLKDWKADKQYYSIGEVAKLFKVNTSHIRFWTNEFNMKVRTTRKGDRLYTSEQIREIRAIYHLVKERGYTIAGAKTKLKEKKKTTIESVSLKQSLLQLRNKLVQVRNQLK